MQPVPESLTLATWRKTHSGLAHLKPDAGEAVPQFSMSRLPTFQRLSTVKAAGLAAGGMPRAAICPGTPLDRV